MIFLVQWLQLKGYNIVEENIEVYNARTIYEAKTVNQLDFIIFVFRCITNRSVKMHAGKFQLMNI